jgi:hypothetical protein
MGIGEKYASRLYKNKRKQRKQKKQFDYNTGKKK